MTERYRLHPEPAQLRVLDRHSTETRFVWNLAVEQAERLWSRQDGQDRGARLGEVLQRASREAWRCDQPSGIQQQALADVERALQDSHSGIHPRPRRREDGLDDGFSLFPATIRRVNRRWATVEIPDCGPVRFRLDHRVPDTPAVARFSRGGSRPPDGRRAAHLIRAHDRGARWYVSFVGPERSWPGPGRMDEVGEGAPTPTRSRPASSVKAKRASVALLAAAVALVAAGGGAGAGAMLLGSTGRGKGSTDALSPAMPVWQAVPVPAHETLVAMTDETTETTLAIYGAEGAHTPTRVLAPFVTHAPLVFDVVSQRPGWLLVDLPVRPDGARGWIKTSQVSLSADPWKLAVQRDAHLLRVYNRDRLVASYPVAIGEADTPSPGGTYYLDYLLQPPDGRGFYGPYAFGLSGFSKALPTFDGGPGEIGLHGTSEPWLIGHSVSHGCIRMLNADIAVLAHELPLGTPIEIAS